MAQWLRNDLMYGKWLTTLTCGSEMYLIYCSFLKKNSQHTLGNILSISNQTEGTSIGTET